MDKFTLALRVDSVVDSVREDLKSRSERGQMEYGTTMDRKDLSMLDWHRHHYEELLDSALYVKKKILMLENSNEQLQDK